MEYVITVLIALFVTFISTPIVKRLAIKLGAVDIPEDGRRMHKNPVALLGGLAIIVGFYAAVFYNIADGVLFFNRHLTGLSAGVLIIIICGLLDDRFCLNAKQKFLFQVAAAIVYVLISESRISFLTNPFNTENMFDLGPYLAWPLTIIWIVGITNAINFVDGLDGLAAGISCISAISLFFVSTSGAVILEGSFTPILMAAIAGAAMGFLPFNFNPAKIFMGETGAAFLGFVLATVSVDGLVKSYAALSLAIPVLIIGLPIFDVIFAVIRRLAKGKSPATADRNHLHHKLIDMGLTQKQSVFILYIASAVLGLCSFIFANKNIMSAVIILILLPVFMFACIRYFTAERGLKEGENGSDERKREFKEREFRVKEREYRAKEEEHGLKEGKDSLKEGEQGLS
ncbi:MAG: undecaprenyl/decaprenyl-phosphate alpha-N-acetylglucosaminyl 1-phosphate transferase [Oscillospiraceae bacterium]|nr:undecaprenyl/decaprenyl-phosphate alpha-N-acetylglucosaminyl 1-phosphate transferase [Oscillospiraceae bacterium]